MLEVTWMASNRIWIRIWIPILVSLLLKSILWGPLCYRILLGNCPFYISPWCHPPCSALTALLKQPQDSSTSDFTSQCCLLHTQRPDVPNQSSFRSKVCHFLNLYHRNSFTCHLVPALPPNLLDLFTCGRMTHKLQHEDKPSCVPEIIISE